MENSPDINSVIDSWEILLTELARSKSPHKSLAQPGEGEPQGEGGGVLRGRGRAPVVSPLGGQEEEAAQEVGEGEPGDGQLASTGLHQSLHTHLDIVIDII